MDWLISSLSVLLYFVPLACFLSPHSRDFNTAAAVITKQNTEKKWFAGSLGGELPLNSRALRAL